MLSTCYLMVFLLPYYTVSVAYDPMSVALWSGVCGLMVWVSHCLQPDSEERGSMLV